MNEFTDPCNIHFELTDGLHNGGIDLHAASAALWQFHQIIDKSYCTLAGKTRLSPKMRKDYQIIAKDLQVGSLVTDLQLVIKGVALALPLMGFANPKSVWDYACYSLDFYKRITESKRKGELPTISVDNSGDHSPTVINLHVGCEVHNYPPEALVIAKKSVHSYRSLANAMESGGFSNLSVVSSCSTHQNLNIKKSELPLFSGINVINQEIISFPVNIIDFNKETMTGKLRVLKNIPPSDIPFSVIGNQNPNLYIDAMRHSLVNVSALAEIADNGVDEEVSRYQLLGVSIPEAG